MALQMPRQGARILFVAAACARATMKLMLLPLKAVSTLSTPLSCAEQRSTGAAAQKATTPAMTHFDAHPIDPAVTSPTP